MTTTEQIEAPALYVATLGRSATVHAVDSEVDMAICGAGLGRGVRGNSPVYPVDPSTPVTCTRCAKRV